ncbi:MAG: hypothetical protein P4M08_14915 [Oligoflexia bacterium]|nr:hypothetical protein [Oligoflexia bacterium]
MDSKKDELLRVEDFDSIRIGVAIQNQTSQTGVGDRFRTYGNVKIEEPWSGSIRLVTFAPGVLVFDTPEKTASEGHILECVVEVLGVSSPFSFEVTGKVTETERLDDQRTKLTLTLTDYDRASLARLQEVYSRRQTEIDEFLKRVRG